MMASDQSCQEADEHSAVIWALLGCITEFRDGPKGIPIEEGHGAFVSADGNMTPFGKDAK